MRKNTFWGCGKSWWSDGNINDRLGIKWEHAFCDDPDTLKWMHSQCCLIQSELLCDHLTSSSSKNNNSVIISIYSNLILMFTLHVWILLQSCFNLWPFISHGHMFLDPGPLCCPISLPQFIEARFLPPVACATQQPLLPQSHDCDAVATVTAEDFPPSSLRAHRRCRLLSAHSKESARRSDQGRRSLSLWVTSVPPPTCGGEAVWRLSWLPSGIYYHFNSCFQSGAICLAVSLPLLL